MSAAAKTKARGRKEARRKPVPGERGPDQGPPERWQHGKMAVGETIAAGVKQAHDQWARQIDRLNERGQITDRMRDAGEQLYQDFLASNVQKPTTGAYEGGAGGGKGRKHGKRPTEVVPHTRPFVAYTAAIEALPNNVASVTRRVVIDDEPPTNAQYAIAAQTRGLSLLQEGLDKLADHYGFDRDVI